MKNRIKIMLMSALLLQIHVVFAQETSQSANNRATKNVELQPTKRYAKILADTFYPRFVAGSGTLPGFAYVSYKKPKMMFSRFFNEAEIGYSHVANKTSYHGNNPFTGVLNIFDTAIFFQPDGPYQLKEFVGNGNNAGFYINLNIRNKSRALWQTDNFYFRNSTQLKFSRNSYGGSMMFRNYQKTKDGGMDTLVKTTTLDATVVRTNLMLGKRFALGYVINPKKQFSVEYGLDMALRLCSNKGENFDSERALRPTNSELFSLRSVSNPALTFNHRIGVNYLNYSLNVGSSFGQRQMGSLTGFSGHQSTIGLAYRFR